MDAERRFIEKILTSLLPKRCRIILRRDREALKEQIERLKVIFEAWQGKLAAQQQDVRIAFAKGFVDEFLPRWLLKPPREYTLRSISAEDQTTQMTNDIFRAVNKLFDQMLQVAQPEFRVIFKDIALEDLQDPDFMTSLRQVMEEASIPAKELETLFEIGHAAPAKGAFGA